MSSHVRVPSDRKVSRIMSSTIRFIVFASLISQIFGAAFYVKLHQDEGKACTIITDETLKRYRGFADDANPDSIHVKSSPAFHLPAYSGSADSVSYSDKSKIVEIYGKNRASIQSKIDSLCRTVQPLEPLAIRAKAPEVLQIVDNGDKANRIDVVFMGDGYTAAEREKFYSDMERLTKDMFEGVTFRSYLPVFNVWAIYVESVESGIGYNGAKDTPFRLYRQAGQLRGIFPGNPAYARQVCQLTGTSGCDYPSLIANDDYYGGLGGEFVISTKSERTGTVVLRHEMGHNFIDVGEEYDGGGVYSGVNSARSLATLGWTSWLTGPVREEKQMYRLLAYPWHDLGTGPRTFTFTSDGTYDNWNIQLSVTAAGQEDSLEFELDGVIVPWATRGSDDREFYDWFGDKGFTSGTHNFIVRSKTTPTNSDIPRMIASITIHEYGNEEEFNHSPDHVSAYPTWDSSYRKTYRPTNEKCSMRNMTSPVFCPVCQEGMWMQFFQRISLIDSVEVKTNTIPWTATVHTLKLGQLREGEWQIPGEELQITWFREGEEQVALKNQFEIYVARGNWRVQVKYVTPEVRHDPTNLLVDSETFVVS